MQKVWLSRLVPSNPPTKRTGLSHSYWLSSPLFCGSVQLTDWPLHQNFQSRMWGNLAALSMTNVTDSWVKKFVTQCCLGEIHHLVYHQATTELRFSWPELCLRHPKSNQRNHGGHPLPRRPGMQTEAQVLTSLLPNGVNVGNIRHFSETCFHIREMERMLIILPSLCKAAISLRKFWKPFCQLHP